MSESSLLTRCPKCQTQFRVTAEQLSVANGKVRCGSCMGIFNALEHRTTSAPAKAAPAEAKPETPTPRFTTEEEFVFADNPEEDATERGYKGKDSLFSEDELSDSFLAMEEGSFTGFAADDEDETGHDVDESWAEAMLDDDHGKKDAAAPAPQQPAPARTTRPEPTFRIEPTPTTKPEPEPEPEPESLSSQPAATTLAQDLQLEAKDRGPAMDIVDAKPEPAARPEPAKTAEGSPSRSKPEQFHNLTREPISVAHRGGRSWLKTTFWTVMVLALLGAAGAQVGYYQFDRLSAVPALRPYYELACQYAGCELAPLVDIDSIQSRKLVVRTDPENRNALVVDAEIVNRAEFDQPFPAIALTFSNLNGDVVAQSMFPPEAYLAGDAAQLAMMPKGVPVRIAIRIRDPGRDAVNYNIAFRPYSP